MSVIFIPDTLTSCNEYISAERTNKYLAAKIKKIETERVRWACFGVPPVEDYPVHIAFMWLCPNKRLDPDNIAFARKFILDGLQKAGVLKDDSWNYINGFSDTFNLAGNRVGVNIVITSRRGSDGREQQDRVDGQYI